MLTSKNFKSQNIEKMIKVEILKNVCGDGKILKAGNIYDLPEKVANSLINYGSAKVSDEKPKAKKTAKKKTAKSAPVIDAQR